MVTRFVTVPDWDQRGLLPPNLGVPTETISSPPYPVRLTEVALRFSNSETRRQLLGGMLDFRQAMHNAGLERGFQWINGSFVEDTIQRRGREPADIDIVTFFHIPHGSSQSELIARFPELFNPISVKSQYGVDAYFVALDVEDKFYLAKLIAFWNNLWHHTREGERKGYLAIDLAICEDGEARTLLNHKSENEAAP